MFTTFQSIYYFVACLRRSEWKLSNFLNFQVFNDIKCPILALLSAVPRSTAFKAMKKTFNFFLNKQNCQCIGMEGNHDVHMNNPERVSPYIVTFLTTQKCAM